MIDPYFSIGLALFASITWGLNSHVLKFGLTKQDPLEAIVIRSAFAIPPLILIVIIWKGINAFSIYFQGDTLLYVIISSILVLFGDAMFITGLQRNKVNEILPVSSIYPLFTTIILIATGTESIGIITVIGTLIIIFGIMIVTSNGKFTSFSKGAFVFGVSAAFGWGTSVFFIKKILDVEGTDGLGLLSIRNAILGVEALIVYLVIKRRTGQSKKRETRTKEERNKSIKYLGISGLLGDSIGASIFFIAVQRIGAAITTPISSTNPIIAAIIGFVAGIEDIKKAQFIGILLCVGGVIVIVL